MFFSKKHSLSNFCLPHSVCLLLPKEHKHMIYNIIFGVIIASFEGWFDRILVIPGVKWVGKSHLIQIQIYAYCHTRAIERNLFSFKIADTYDWKVDVPRQNFQMKVTFPLRRTWSSKKCGSRTYLSHVMRKPVLAICEQQRCRSACAAVQSDQCLCCSLPR